MGRSIALFLPQTKHESCGLFKNSVADKLIRFTHTFASCDRKTVNFLPEMSIMADCDLYQFKKAGLLFLRSLWELQLPRIVATWATCYYTCHENSVNCALVKVRVAS